MASIQVKGGQTRQYGNSTSHSFSFSLPSSSVSQFSHFPTSTHQTRGLLAPTFLFLCPHQHLSLDIGTGRVCCAAELKQTTLPNLFFQPKGKLQVRIEGFNRSVPGPLATGVNMWGKLLLRTCGIFHLITKLVVRLVMSEFS